MVEYTKAFCPVDSYLCLMPIEYELVEEVSGKRTYKKVRCCCHNVVDGKCDKSPTCEHFMMAEEVIVK